MTHVGRRMIVGGAAASAMLSTTVRGEVLSMDAIEANKARIATFIEVVWRQGRLDELPDFWAADCVNHADPASEKRGLQALRKYHEGFAQAFADFDGMDIHLDQQVAEGDRVVTQMTTRARHKPSGRQVSLATIRIDRLEHGKIAEHWSVADMAGLMQQLG